MKLKSELNQIKNFIIKITRKKNNLYNHLTFTSKLSCKNKILILTKVKNNCIYNYINEAIKKNIRAVITDNKIDIRKVNKDIKIGVCGEHAGEANSIQFFNTLQIDYISYSPFRIPTAKLAAGQAEIIKTN